MTIGSDSKTEENTNWKLLKIGFGLYLLQFTINFLQVFILSVIVDINSEIEAFILVYFSYLPHWT